MSIRRFVVPILLSQVIITSSVAQTMAIPLPQPGEKDVGAAISPLKKGQTAPFTGNLLSPTAVATIIAELDSIPDRVKVEVERAVGEAEAKCQFKLSELKTDSEANAKTLAAKIEQQQRVISSLNEIIKKQDTEKPNAALWGTIGAVGGLVVGVALTAVIASAVN